MSLTPHAIESGFVLDCIQAEELGSGMMFAAMFRDLFVFSHASQEWFIWRGHFWERDCDGAALAAVDLVAQRVAEEAIPIEARIEEHREAKNEYMRKAAEKERKKIVDYVRSLRRKTGRANCLVFAATLPEGQSLGIKGNEFDQDPWLFGCINGVIDCGTGRFRPGRPKDYITKVSPVAFDPSAKCPTYIAFLESCHDNKEVIGFKKRWAGYMMTGCVDEQKYVVNIGAGRNGKGVDQEALSAVFGPHSRSVKSEILLDQGRFNPRPCKRGDCLSFKRCCLGFQKAHSAKPFLSPYFLQRRIMAELKLSCKTTSYAYREPPDNSAAAWGSR